MSDKAPTTDLLMYFDQLHRQRFQVPAVLVRGRDAKQIADIWRQHGETATRQLMQDFFQLVDPWLDSHGYSVPMFALRLPALVIARPRRPPVVPWWRECQQIHGGSCHSPEWHRIRKIQDAEKNGGGK